MDVGHAYPCKGWGDDNVTCAWIRLQGGTVVQRQPHSLVQVPLIPVAKQSQDGWRRSWMQWIATACFVPSQCPMRSTTHRWSVFLVVESYWWFLPPSQPGQFSHAKMSKPLIHRGFETRRLPSQGFVCQSEQITWCGRCRMQTASRSHKWELSAWWGPKRMKLLPKEHDMFPHQSYYRSLTPHKHLINWVMTNYCYTNLGCVPSRSRHTLFPAISLSRAGTLAPPRGGTRGYL